MSSAARACRVRSGRGHFNNGDGVVDFGDINPFVALLGTGNSGLTRAQTWDGEDRLIKVEPAGAVIADGAQKAEYVYDYLGRRVEKKVWTYAGGSWGTPAVRRFVWSVGVSPANWLLLMELEGSVGVPPVNTVLRKYTWGLDLARQSGSVGVPARSNGPAGHGEAEGHAREAHAPLPSTLRFQ
jgi:hypothetical protein